MLQVDYLVVAEAALAANNRHYIHGTIDVLWATAVPVTHPSLSIAIRLRVPWNDANTPFPLEIDLVDPDEESILSERPQGTITMGRPATAVPGEDSLVPLVYNLVMIQFRKPGTHGVVLRMGGRELQRARFQVRLVANRQPVAPIPAQPPLYTPPPAPRNPPSPPPAPQPQPPIAQQPSGRPSELPPTPSQPPPQPPPSFELLPHAPAQPTPQSPPRPAEDQATREHYAPPASPPRQDTPTSNEPPGPPHLPFSLGGLAAAERETPPSPDGSTPRE
jgi:hypothetical protein